MKENAKKTLSLKDCVFGRSYRVVKINQLPIKIRRRLCDLGFVPNTEVRLLRRSLLGKAYLLELRGYVLSVRWTLAEAIVVEGLQ